MLKILKALISYTGYLIKHKYYVYIFGRKLGLNRTQLLKHDISKFKPRSFLAYAFYFYGPIPATELEMALRKRNFKKAWRKHVNNEPHHWEYYWSYDGVSHNVESIPIEFLLEMIADWHGASKINSNSDDWDISFWYNQYNWEPRFSSDTYWSLRNQMERLGYNFDTNDRIFRTGKLEIK
ncbi:MAG: DUF5662 family protein [Flavobacteriaceae bacterium]|nr:DUF5662 family protein [Flavobacteriaceae bacterium]